MVDGMQDLEQHMRSGDGWDRKKSLQAGRAMTRDGRWVFDLRELTLMGGKTILVGKVSTKRHFQYKTGETVFTEHHYWQYRGAWGIHGGDDLMTIYK